MKVYGIGRVGSDPESRITTNGNTVATFAFYPDEFPVSNGHKASVRLECWSGLAEKVVMPYVKVGRRLFVEGNLRINKGQDGKYYTSIRVDSLKFLDVPQNGDNGNQQVEEPELVDEIPF